MSASSGLSAVHLGLYQFISPIISAAVAVTLFGEHLTIEKLVISVGLMLGLALAALPLGRIAQGWRGRTITKREIE